MKSLIMITLLLNVSCGTFIKVKGGTENKVSGSVEQKIVIEIPMCNDLPPQEKVECIQAFVDLFKSLSKKTCNVNEDGSIPDTEECKKIVDAIKKEYGNEN